MKKLFLLMPLVFLAACTPPKPTSLQVANKLQQQITELLDEVDRRLEEAEDLDLDGLCANSGTITAGMDMLVPKYRAFAAVMESQGDMNQALMARGAANQFAIDAKKIRRDCEARAAVPLPCTASDTEQSPGRTPADDSGLGPVNKRQGQQQQ